MTRGGVMKFKLAILGFLYLRVFFSNFTVAEEADGEAIEEVSRPPIETLGSWTRLSLFQRSPKLRLS